VNFPHALIRPGRRALATAVTLAMAGAGLTALGPAAQAATPNAVTAGIGHTALRESFTVPAGKADFNATVDGVHVSVLRNGKVSPETTCTINVANPSIVDGGVEGSVGLGCTSEVYELVVGVALYYDSASGWVEESYTVNAATYTTFIDALTNTPAIAGDWEAVGVGDIYWSSPSSYSTVSEDSAVVYIP
jgi:hypothetical protein